MPPYSKKSYLIRDNFKALHYVYWTFVGGIHLAQNTPLGPVDSPHKRPVMQKAFARDDVIIDSFMFVTSRDNFAIHDDVIKWKNFPRYWPFVRGIHRWVTGEFPAQRPVTRSFGVFFDLRPNKGLSKQWWGWWFETPSSPLWSHCNVV